jgi:sugar lactone lactonase YvrE
MKMQRSLLGIASIITVLSATSPNASATLYIGNSAGNSILLFDEFTGTLQGDFITPGLGGLRAPDTITIGPDGNFYISSGGSSSRNLLDPLYPTDSAVLRYSPTGQFLGVAASGNGLARPYGNAFGPDGNLYVSSFRSNQILRFDGKTGAFLDVFASDNNGGFGSVNGLNGPNGLLFTPDGSLYVTTQGSANDTAGNLTFPSTFSSQVLRYTPEQVKGTQSTINPQVFIEQPALLPENPDFVSLLGLVLAPNNDILVSDFAGGIRRYSPGGSLVSVLSTNYTGTTPSSSFFGALTFGGDRPDTLYTVGFDSTSLVGSVLGYPGGQGSASVFTGSLFTDERLERPIGIAAAAVPEPSTVLGILATAAGLGAARRRRSAS